MLLAFTITADPDCNAPWEDSWSTYVDHSVRASMLKYNPSKRYWVSFIKALAKTESCLNPTEHFKEPGLGTDMVTHLPIYSDGLLQMSYQDSVLHGCPFSYESRNIFNPINNLECGIIVLEKQIQRFGTPYHRYYWSSLDKKNLRYQVFKRYLEEEPQ